MIYASTNTALTNANGDVVCRQAFDPWGRRRNVYNWVADDNAVPPANIARWLRGFTGHEHLDAFALVNMNARLYDPKLGRMLSVDNFVSMPGSAMGYNRYSYANNNPLKYTDPSGNFLWFFTDWGYEFQKTFFPVALRINIHFGGNQKGLGFDASVGMPKISPFSYRYNFGSTYFWKNNEMGSGWEKREGGQVSYIGFLTIENTRYSMGSESQSVTTLSIGSYLGGMDYANDAKENYFSFGLLKHSDGGDRWRTAAFRWRLFADLSIGFNIQTGDGGPDRTKIGYQNIGGFKTYVPYGNYNPDDRRMGAIYIGIGPFKIGWNSEGIRNFIQNTVAHDFISNGQNKAEGPYHFRKLDRAGKPYLNFSTGGLW